MDLETRQLNGKMEVVCLSICYSDKTTRTFGIWDYKIPDQIIIEAFKTVLTKENSKSMIYFHNFSGFDSIFIISILVKKEALSSPEKVWPYTDLFTVGPIIISIASTGIE